MFILIYLSVFFHLLCYTLADNVLFIVVDDLRPSIRCYGDEDAFTPNLDKLGQQSAVFHRAFSQQALCAPSRNSFLTSRRPDTLRLYDFYNYWREFSGNFTTLPQYFKQNGFYTVSLGKVFHPGVSSNFTDDYPLSWSELPWHPPTQIYQNAKVCPDVHGWFKNVVCPVSVRDQPGSSLPDIETTNEAIKFIKTRNSSQPFFLAVGLHKPHLPLKYPQQYKDFHPLENVSLPSLPSYPPSLPTVAWNPWTDLRERHDIDNLNLTFPFQSVPESWQKLIRQSYFAAVTYIDALIGKILKQLEKSSLDMNTTVVLLGDHGWSLGEHGEWAKYSNFEVAVRVPLMLRIPGITYFSQSSNMQYNGVQSKELVELVDIFPTLVDLFHLPTIPQCPFNQSLQVCTEGVSLVPLIKTELENSFRKRTCDSKQEECLSKSLQWRTAAFSQYPRPGVVPTHHPNSDKPRLKEIAIMGYTMRTKQYRFTQWVQWIGSKLQPNWNNIIATELYDHNFDPEENLNIAGRPGLKEIEAILHKQLMAGWRAAYPK